MGNFVFFDLEATCCDDDSIPRHESEIIEIGAACVNEKLEIISEFSEFIRPVVHPVLHPFCTKLTTISQDEVDGARGAAEVFDAFAYWLDSHNVAGIGSWGNYDPKMLQHDADYHGIPCPVEEIPFCNVKQEFSNRRKGLGRALRSLNLSFEGTQHRAISDALNIIHLLRAKTEVFDRFIAKIKAV